MTTTNLLQIGAYATDVTYTAQITNKKGKLTGSLVVTLNHTFDGGKSTDDIWEEIISAGANHNGMTYIISVKTNAQQLTYIGKTLNTMKERYGQQVDAVKGGLKLVFDGYIKGKSFLECTLYNVSHPALVEGWCYQIAEDKKWDLANKQDPS